MDLKSFGVIFLMIGIAKCSEDFIHSHNAADAPISTRKYSTFIDLVIDEISSQEWNGNELQCQEQILDILRNVQNSTLWATWIWNSMQLPTGQFYGAYNHIGNFDQCLRRLWKDDPVPTQYCLADVQLTATNNNKDFFNVNAYDTAESYLSIKTKYDFKFNVMSRGVCVPAVCKKQSVKRFVGVLFKLSHMGPINDHPEIEVQDCQRTHMPPNNTTALYLLLITAVVLVVVACVCTYICNQKSTEHHPILMRIISGFDLRSNASNLLAVNNNDIAVMHGVRSLTSCIVLFLHVFLTHLVSSLTNALDLNKDLEFYSRYLSHASIFVDTFFMMSGLLLMMSFKPGTGRIINPFKVIIKRYFRFIWILSVMIVVIIYAAPYLIAGPMWMKFGKREMESCEKNWWLNLLMLNNYVDNENICMQISWYIPADYHMAVVSVILYCFYQRNRRGGLYLFGFIGLASVILPGIYTYVNELEAIPAFRIGLLKNTRKNILDKPVYVYSHFRASSYSVGLAAGYILSIYKPANYRNVISKTRTTLYFLVITALGTSILLTGSLFMFREYNALESALFVAINRPLWAALCAAFIMICEYGSLPIISKFLSWTPFVPLSRLSYGMYLSQYIFLLRLIVSPHSHSWYDMLNVFQDGFGVIVMVVLISLYVALFIESPLNNLIDLAINIIEQPKNQVNDTANKHAANIESVCAKNELEVCWNKENCCANGNTECHETNGVRETNNDEYLRADGKKYM